MNLAITTSEKVLAVMADPDRWYTTTAILDGLGIDRDAYQIARNVGDILYYLESRGAITSRKFGRRRKLYKRATA